jgi:group I intron endonuclease
MSNFRLYILEYATARTLLLREQFWINLIDPAYNIYKVAGNTVGFKHSLSTIERMREASNKRVVSEETRQRMREARLGFKQSQKVINKLKSRVYTPEHRAKISLALTGRKVSEETKNKLREKYSFKVEVKDLQTNTVKYYSSITIAAKVLGASRSTISSIIETKKAYRNRYLIKLA